MPKRGNITLGSLDFTILSKSWNAFCDFAGAARCRVRFRAFLGSSPPNPQPVFLSVGFPSLRDPSTGNPQDRNYLRLAAFSESCQRSVLIYTVMVCLEYILRPVFRQT